MLELIILLISVGKVKNTNLSIHHTFTSIYVFHSITYV